MSEPSNNQLINMLTTDDSMHGSDADLAAMLEHQLSLPLAATLIAENLLDPPAAESLARLAGRQIRDAFTTPNPPLELLTALKLLGKSPRNPAAPDSALTPIHRLLYFTAIATADIRLHIPLSSLTPAELRTAYTWCLSLPWLPPDLRQIFQSALLINP